MRTTRLFIALVPMLAGSLLLTVSIGRASEKTEGDADGASTPKDAVSLNNLDDWYEFHQAVLR